MSSADRRKRTAAFVVVTAVVIGAVATVTAGHDWSGWRPASCVAEGCFCEAVDPSGPIGQPANTWSSLAYAAAGLAMLARTWPWPSRRPSPFDTPPYVAPALALCVISVGLGSAFLHASLTFAGQFADVFSMYLVATFIGVYALRRLLLWTDRAVALVWIGVNVVLGLGLLLAPESRRFAFGLAIVAGIALEAAAIRWRGEGASRRRFVAGIAVFAAAYAVWLLDNGRVLCEPASLVQGHAAWHVLGAVATWLLFLHYRALPRYTRST